MGLCLLLPRFSLPFLSRISWTLGTNCLPPGTALLLLLLSATPLGRPQDEPQVSPCILEKHFEVGQSSEGLPKGGSFAYKHRAAL